MDTKEQVREMEIRKVLLEYALAVLDGYGTADVSLKVVVDKLDRLYDRKKN